MDGIEAEAPLERNLIYMRNRDIPGVIGRVGTILGEHKINIANFSLGRRAEGEPGLDLDRHVANGDRTTLICLGDVVEADHGLEGRKRKGTLELRSA